MREHQCLDHVSAHAFRAIHGRLARNIFSLGVAFLSDAHVGLEPVLIPDLNSLDKVLDREASSNRVSIASMRLQWLVPLVCSWTVVPFFVKKDRAFQGQYHR